MPQKNNGIHFSQLPQKKFSTLFNNFSKISRRHYLQMSYKQLNAISKVLKNSLYCAFNLRFFFHATSWLEYLKFHMIQIYCSIENFWWNYLRRGSGCVRDRRSSISRAENRTGVFNDSLLWLLFPFSRAIMLLIWSTFLPPALRLGSSQPAGQLHGCSRLTWSSC